MIAVSLEMSDEPKYCSLWRMFLKYNKNGVYSFSNATSYSRQTQSFNKLSAHACNYCKTRAEKNQTL